MNTDAVRAEFVDLCEKAGVDPKDSKSVFEGLPWLGEWRETLMQNTVVVLRNKNQLKAKIQAEVKPIIAIVRPIHMLPSSRISYCFSGTRIIQ